MLHLLSADHRTHGLDVVARLGATTAHLGPDLLDAVPGLDGAVVLGTCNRVAVLLDAPDAPAPAGSGAPAAPGSPAATADGAPSDPVPGRLPGQPAGPVEESVSSLLADRAGLSPDELALAAWRGRDAVAELFSTAAGLESMVVGEREIAGQLRRAMAAAGEDGTLTGPLARAVEHASTASRRVASTTGLAGTGRSVVAVGLDLAQRHLPPLNRARILLVGTGAYAGATVTALRERGATDIEVYSRSDRAAAFAEGHGVRAVDAAGLPESLALADLVVTCRGLGHPVLTRELVEPAVRTRRPAGDALLDRREEPASRAEPAERPLVVLDLALTRDVEESVGTLPGVLLIDLVSVQRAVPEAEAEAVRAARAVVDGAVDDFVRLQGARRMDPVIRELRAHVDSLVEDEAARLRPVDGMVDADDARRALERLANRLLHHPTVAARTAGEEGREEEYLDALGTVMGAHVAQGLSAGLDAPRARTAAAGRPAQEGHDYRLRRSAEGIRDGGGSPAPTARSHPQEGNDD